MKKRLIRHSLEIVALVIIIAIIVNWNGKRTIFSPAEYSFSQIDKCYLLDNGLYYFMDGIAKYYDRETEMSVSLGEERGSSYYENPAEMLIYNNKFYCATFSEQVVKGFCKEILYECDCDGNHRNKIFEFPPGGSNGMYANNGKLYYVLNSFDVDDKVSEEDFSQYDEKEKEAVMTLHAFDLNTHKDKVLYEIRDSENTYSGSVKLCATDDISKVYFTYRCFDSETMKGDSMDELRNAVVSKILCYDIQTGKVKTCFKNFDEHSFPFAAAIYNGNLYCKRYYPSSKQEYTTLERYCGEDGKRQQILKITCDSILQFLDGYTFLNNGINTVVYDMKKDICYKQKTKENFYVKAISQSGAYVALDDGDYSDLKNGDIYMKSRFVPKILKMEEFLESFDVFEGGNADGVEYNKEGIK